MRFFALIIVFLGIIGYAVWVIDHNRSDAENAMDARILRYDSVRARVAILTIIMRDKVTGDKVDQSELDEIKTLTTDTWKRIEALRAYFETDDEGRRLVEDFAATYKEYVNTRNNLQIPLILSHKYEEARRLSLGENYQRFNHIRDVAGLLAERASLIANQRAEQAKLRFAMASLLAIIFGAYLALSLQREIAMPMAKLKEAAERLSSGNVAVDLPEVESDDELGSLTRAFNRMSEGWREISQAARRIADGDLTLRLKQRSDVDDFTIAFNSLVQSMAQVTAQFRDAVYVVSTTASDIIVSVNQSAIGANETATAANETSAIVEQVRQTSQLASQKAKQVSDSAQKTAQITAAGRRATEDIIEGMNRIREQVDLIAEAMVRLSEKSQSISGIIATVDDLAKQSNLLAVNASIEAARAGELGRGFGVVAQEVKNMAEQSKHSTAQVRAIIAEIQQATNAAAMATELGGKAVDAALHQSGRAGESIAVLAGSVLESAQAAAQIAVSNQQQLAGVDQVATAMSSIRDACEEHIEAIRHVEISANRLNEIGIKLKALIDRYDVWESAPVTVEG